MPMIHYFQDAYFLAFGNHFLSTICSSAQPIGKGIVHFYYGNRPWRQNPVFQTKDGHDLLFIHVPKCGGTSIGKAFGHANIRHFPVAVFKFSDSIRFKKCITFSVLRNPIERLYSIIRHLQHSHFATDYEKRLYGMIDHSVEGIHEAILSLANKGKLYRKLYFGTKIGRGGFPVSQLDFIHHKNELLVGNLFTLDNMTACVDWLSQFTEKPIVLGRHNASPASELMLPEFEEGDFCEEFRREMAFYQKLESLGGVALDGSDEMEELRQFLIS